MRNKLFAIAAVALLLISGFVLAQGNGRHYDDKETIEGCLEWICPTIYGADYPEDCSPRLCNSDGCISMVFDESTQHLRDKLNEYWGQTAGECIRIKARGIFQVSECPVGDTACVSTENFRVTDLKIINEKVPVCSCRSSDINRDGIVNYKDLAICGALGINKCGACIQNWYGIVC